MPKLINFPVVIHKDPRSDYGVTVPDLPGCFSAGSSIDEALDLTREAIQFHIEGLTADGESIPRPKLIEQHKKDRAFADGTWAIVSFDPAYLPGRAVRINITLPEKVLRRVDRFAKAAGETRSGLLAVAAAEYVKSRTKAKK